MKYIIGIVLMTFYNLSFAQNGSLNLALPSTPGSYQSDRFRAGELDCSMAIGSGTNVEFGVMGIINNNPNQSVINNMITPNTRDVGVYGRITIPIGAPKGRINCDTLYQMELSKKRMEIEKLELEIRNLRNLKFEK